MVIGAVVHSLLFYLTAQSLCEMFNYTLLGVNIALSYCMLSIGMLE